MRRSLAFLLLIFLPLQFTWAGVAAYCKHETGVAAQHLGHHSHTHKTETGSDSTPNTPADAKVQWGFDNDCSTCYSGFISVLPNSVNLSAVTPTNSLIEWLPDSMATPPHPQPERPNWLSLA